jgi:RimJ/RimL family protein N-acetyltransferase
MTLKDNSPKIKSFETDRMIVRPLSIDDASRIQHILTEDVYKFVPEISQPLNSTDWINKKLEFCSHYMCHVVILKEINDIIGYFQMINSSYNINNDDYAIDIGYWFGQEFWNNGYCSEVLKAIIEHIIEPNNWTQEIVALVYDGNKSSEHVLVKNGFRNPNLRRKTKHGDANLFVYESKYYKKHNK